MTDFDSDADFDLIVMLISILIAMCEAPLHFCGRNDAEDSGVPTWVREPLPKVAHCRTRSLVVQCEGSSALVGRCRGG